MNFCYTCGAPLPPKPLYCPNCGIELISRKDIDRIKKMLKRNSEYENQSAQKSKTGFFKWLKAMGYGEIVKKLIELAWKVIKNLFGL